MFHCITETLVSWWHLTSKIKHTLSAYKCISSFARVISRSGIVWRIWLKALFFLSHSSNNIIILFKKLTRTKTKIILYQTFPIIMFCCMTKVIQDVWNEGDEYIFFTYRVDRIVWPLEIPRETLRIQENFPDNIFCVLTGLSYSLSITLFMIFVGKLYFYHWKPMFSFMSLYSTSSINVKQLLYQAFCDQFCDCLMKSLISMVHSNSWCSLHIPCSEQKNNRLVILSQDIILWKLHWL